MANLIYYFPGVSLGPLLDMVIRIDPSIVVTALMGTCLIFISFSLAALYNTDRKFLYMGGKHFEGLVQNYCNLLYKIVKKVLHQALDFIFLLT